VWRVGCADHQQARPANAAMLGISSYDSDEEAAEPVAEPTAAAGAAAAPAGVQPKAVGVIAVAAGKAAPKGKAVGKSKSKEALSASRLKHIRKEVDEAKSATAVVQVVRRCLEDQWDARWGADALHQIAKRSTARTRKEWAADLGVKKLADKLKALTADHTSLPGLGNEGVDVSLKALDALRRMNFQEAEEQKDALERAIVSLVADNWKHPVKSLARLFWLGAPLKLQGRGGSGDYDNLLPAELRARAPDLDGPDVAVLIAAMRREGLRDEALLQKVVGRLKVEGIHAGLSATDLVEMTEGLKELGGEDEAALRPLGQEILRRRGELNPDESHRVHAAFQAMKLPLPSVWMKPGAATKRGGSQILTTQAFAPQEGHEKKRRGNNEIERVSPPRVVRDYKMMSY